MYLLTKKWPQGTRGNFFDLKESYLNILKHTLPLMTIKSKSYSKVLVNPFGQKTLWIEDVIRKYITSCTSLPCACIGDS